MRQKLKGIQGFTLVEILIAVSILSVLSVSLYFQFQTGLFLYLRTKQDMTRLDEVRLALYKMEREIQNIVILPDITFEAKKDQLSFASYTTYYDQEKEENGLMEIEYSFKGSDLFRSARQVTSGFQEEKKKTDKFLHQVILGKFEFAHRGPKDEIVWMDTWEGENKEGTVGSRILPPAIRVTFEFRKDLKKREKDKNIREEDYLSQKIQKVILLPQGIWQEVQVV